MSRSYTIKAFWGGRCRLDFTIRMIMTWLLMKSARMNRSLDRQILIDLRRRPEFLRRRQSWKRRRRQGSSWCWRWTVWRRTISIPMILRLWSRFLNFCVRCRGFRSRLGSWSCGSRIRLCLMIRCILIGFIVTYKGKFVELSSLMIHILLVSLFGRMKI